MAIRVKHDTSAAVIGESAYTVGRGQRRERDIRFTAEVNLRQQALNLQAASIVAQGRRSREQLALQERGMELGAERSAEQFALQQEEFGFRKQQEEDRQGFQLQRRLEEQQRIKEQKTIYEYTPVQIKELEKINTGRATLEAEYAAGKWDLEQVENLMGQFDRKERLVIPQARIRTEMTPQEIWDSGVVTDSTGAKHRMNEKGGFDPLGISFKDYAKLRADSAKSFTKEEIRKDADGKLVSVETVDWEAADKFVDDTMVRYAKIQGLAAKTEQEAERRVQQGPPEPSIAEKAQMRADVLALPRQFEKLIKKPLIGRKVAREEGLLWDKVFGEEAYNKTFLKAIEDNPKIPPDVIKAELNKWWDTKYQEEKGQRRQKFENRLEFEGAALKFEGASREAAPAEVKTAPVILLRSMWPRLTDEQKQKVWLAWKQAQAEGVSAEKFGRKAIAVFGGK